MNSEKEKTYYSLLVEKDVLLHLNNKDKGELSLTCKYIFDLTHKLRLSSLDLTLIYFIKVGYGNPDMPSDLEVLRSKQQDLLDSSLRKRSRYTKKLTVDSQLNYSIIAHVISNLNNLTSLYLSMVMIPKQFMQQIFDSLPFLNILRLDKIIVSLPTSDELSNNLKFPKYLKDLKLDSCRQLNCDITDAVALRNQYFFENIKQLPTMDISHESLTKLYQTTIQDTEQIHIPVYNQLIGNLTQLSRYNTLISCLNNDSLSIISRSSNLSTLSFDFFYYEPPSTITKFIELPYVKVLDLAPIIYHQVDAVKSIVQCCINLESLKYYWTPQTHLYEILNVEKFPKLKKLAIINYLEGYQNLHLSTHSLNLEYIEIHQYDPLQIDTYALITSFPMLERIKIILLDKYVDVYESIRYYFQQHPDWRTIFHPNSIDLRKIK